MSYYLEFAEYPDLCQKLRKLYLQEIFSYKDFAVWIEGNYNCSITDNYDSYPQESLIFDSEQTAFLFLMNHL